MFDPYFIEKTAIDGKTFKNFFMKKILSFILLSIFFFCSCDAVVEKTDEKEAAVKGVSTLNVAWAKNFIDSMNNHVTECISNGDSAGVASLYWPDAEIILPNSEPVKGSQAASVFGSMIRMGVKHFTIETSDLKTTEGYIIETGKFSMNDAANKNIDKGNYVVVWQNRDGQWKLYRDIGNSSLPAVH